MSAPGRRENNPNGNFPLDKDLNVKARSGKANKKYLKSLGIIMRAVSRFKRCLSSQKLDVKNSEVTNSQIKGEVVEEVQNTILNEPELRLVVKKPTYHDIKRNIYEKLRTGRLKINEEYASISTLNVFERQLLNQIILTSCLELAKYTISSAGAYEIKTPCFCCDKTTKQSLKTNNEQGFSENLKFSENLILLFGVIKGSEHLFSNFTQEVANHSQIQQKESTTLALVKPTTNQIMFREYLKSIRTDANPVNSIPSNIEDVVHDQKLNDISSYHS
ncbi:uncharacterized protein LOC119662642 [Teleopsis dalmanni]|uniref:uncharacterized protein LOC119662642 n=1 Tax=Teleopsis dalmanni TaxID=139649 RepID=UPI0018CFAB43|nr:uncharacterized protein LOC119662642 [Teleopsis dalmanni]XP_037928233.1 uncharacterized protein LOC119662642 [Teleopsis dalmanni]XP_037928234.1 uncharacterized protein LOC119662642 [Teleopsis dalmanni]XP_037928235.1 uncharacterized protein LOC119662642 [Teleopsis dalmanni]